MSNDHLTSEQIEALLTDSGARDRVRHLSDCQTCSAELESLAVVMRDLRVAAIASAEQHRRVAVLPALSRRTVRMTWALLATAATVCIAGPIAMHRRPAGVIAGVTAIHASVQQVQGEISDEQLLSNVQEDLSSPVPEPMLPLVASVATTSTSATSAKENE